MYIFISYLLVFSYFIIVNIGVSGREGGGSGLWGMLGDFNNAEAVQ